ncbi:patatin-like phospholipase family protein [Gammaproteobacteria bacterium]|nr:patatin-like phospholipase family protein [Gammaproteobacteria bacterium]
MAAQELGYKNFVFQGGGVKGIAYIGALAAWERHTKRQCDTDTQLQNISASSVGSLFALLLALRFDLSAIKHAYEKFEVHKITENSLINSLSIPISLIQNYGIYDGKYLRQACEKILLDKTGSKHTTFNQLASMKDPVSGLAFRHPIIIAADNSYHRQVVFCADNCAYRDFDYHSGEIKIVDAIMASIAIPFLFKAQFFKTNSDNKLVKLNSYQEKCHVLVDGCLVNDYPWDLFKSEMNSTLGFYFKLQKSSCNQASSLAAHMYQILCLSYSTSRLYHEHNQQIHKQTVFIDTKYVNGINFKLSDHNKQLLLKRGYCSTARYFKKIKKNTSILKRWISSLHKALYLPNCS